MATKPAPGAGDPARYDRPDQPWLCGRTGEPCRRGPAADGACGAGPGCAPARVGDRWTCTRPASAGGPCQAGPTPEGACGTIEAPCVPVRGHLSRRRRQSLWWAVMVVGLVALFLGGSLAVDTISPGPLRAAHAGLADCATCHGPTAEKGVLDWVAAAFAPVDVHQANGRCLTCHADGVADGDPVQAAEAVRAAGGPHGRAWAAETPAADGVAPDAPPPVGNTGMARLAGLVFDAPRRDEPLACAACHAEHRGDHDPGLGATAEAACRVCHTSVGKAFPEAHPPLGTYPFARRTALIFDHAAHLDRHFPDHRRSGGTVSDSCLSCHRPDDQGRFMTSLSFDTTCARCHAGDIREADRAVGPKGIALFTVPGLDLRSLEEHGVAVGAWPAYAEAPPSPALALLLADDAEGAAALDRLAGRDLLDLRDADAATLNDVAALAWAVKRAVARLLEAGPEAALSGLGGAGAASLPSDVARAMQRQWFPDLSQELRALEAGDAPATRPVRDEPDATSGPAQEADAAPAAVVEGDDLLGGDIMGGGDSDILGGGDILTAEGDDAGILGGGGDILGAGGDIHGGGGDILGDGDGAAGLDAGSIPELREAGAGAAESPPVRAVDDPALWGQGGGWRREGFTVAYLAVAHADPLVAGWYDAAARRAADPAGAAWFASLTERAPGGCVKCHAVERETSAAPPRVAWTATPRNAWPQTRFHHATHFTATVEDGCVTCHTPQSGDAYAKSFTDAAALTPPKPGLRPVSAETCASCHAQQEGLSDCTACHDYHGTAMRRWSPY